MIDKSPKIGGAWASLSLFGFKNVENAVHYILPDKSAYNVLQYNLQLQIQKSEKKFRIFNLPFGRFCKLSFDGIVGKVISYLYKQNYKKLNQLLFLKDICDSHYFKNGANDITNKLTDLLKKSKIKIILNSKIKKIIIDKIEKPVKIYAAKKTFYAKKIVLTHGTKLPKFFVFQKTVSIIKKRLYRPSIHLLFNDKGVSQVNEAIFENDDLLKYAHDITRYASSNKTGFQNGNILKIVVCALNHSTYFSKSLPKKIEQKLKKIKLISLGAKLRAHYWQDIFLPELDSSDLVLLRNKCKDKIEVLNTENFSKALKQYSPKWFVQK